MCTREQYTVGWICAITTEYVAAKQMLDTVNDPVPLSHNQRNTYTFGKVGSHNIVISVLPIGEYGISSAARVAEEMIHNFPNLRIGLMVGIGGGAPSPKHDIRLGDIVVSTPHNGHGGVFQYDYGKTMQDQTFRQTGFLDQPPTVLRAAVSELRAQYMSDGHALDDVVSKILDKKPRLRRDFARPDSATDLLYKAHVVHPKDSEEPCNVNCGSDPSLLVTRDPRGEYDDDPAIHYGIIASANQLMKDALTRTKMRLGKAWNGAELHPRNSSLVGGNVCNKQLFSNQSEMLTTIRISNLTSYA
ncbi:Uncharacterized protein PECH_004376 [Penicillium ucsense]|uniref:Nucleoside phosphorylase domain-containing protein n=1 Tax=Penicillium ucsense TaxID=2839758 RepID=A0A8J8W2Y9_9EURO|nr:Uncharacterized protein PECM_005330 [Penicillium ucsense]KAF7737064.1 Uncharacterized protein PECH_004376 [Penicillium ucsense]